ncbi:hypothetical protein PENANT_c001G00306 [Penicillium antarcticum]|uniref:Ferric reductase NAD binding domain-containing protein n=2 Tax=Penicillium antarcticum TaxID=416450 RepID=A0A1V6QP91_9EURO|nr:hypothetical protein PENANT_c001G00306 [Penicillium antarcticum]
MWVLDWGMRLYELRECLPGEVTHLGQGWYCINMLLPRHRLDGCACKSPVAHFYIRHSKSSVRELHPFTTITPLAYQKTIVSEFRDDIPIQFLFRKSGNMDNLPGPQFKNKKRPIWFHKSAEPIFQWTEKLANLADQRKSLSRSGEDSSVNQSIGPPFIELANKNLVSSYPSEELALSLRLEGPYFSEADPSRYRTVVCFVAGTGVSGAIAIARAFLEQKRQETTALTTCRGSQANDGSNAPPIWER